MAASIQLEQTSAGHFGRVDSGSDRDTAGHSVCNSGWTSGTGGYMGVLATVYLLHTDLPLRMMFKLKLSINFSTLA